MCHPSLARTPHPAPIDAPPDGAPPCLSTDRHQEGERLIVMARQTRRHAEAYREIANRYCQEMPGYLDRFHEAIRAFRITAACLRRGQPAPMQPQAAPPRDGQSG